MRYFDEYQHELKNSIIGIKKHIQGSKKSKSYTQNPYKISVDIYNFLSNHNSDLNISQKIRAFHNFYGWKAWGEVNNFGLCSGAIYRTEEYLNINPNSRTGKKRVLEGKRRIHIEHSMPINEIHKLLQLNSEKFTCPKDIFNKILEFSVCTAFSEYEEKNGIRKGFSRNSSASFNESELCRRNIYVFNRYKQGVRVFDMLSGEKLIKDTPLDRLTRYYHQYEIYKWEFIEKNYKLVYE